MQPNSEEIARFVFDLKFKDIPEEVIKDVKYRFLDIIGICLACWKMEYATVLINYIRELDGKKTSTIIGTDLRCRHSRSGRR